jgi:hypothetical protein
VVTLTLGDRTLEFRPAYIEFRDCRSSNTFSKKNNKTLRQTLIHPKYIHLTSSVTESYASALDRKLGDFLLELKQNDQYFYRQFLNQYGDETYCEFLLKDSTIKKLKGLYCFTVSGAVKYIGKSIDSFERRINHGYGRIHPKNCYRDGQATNCHLNALIACCAREVALFVHPMLDDEEIAATEAALIAKERPEWNIQLK